MLANPFGPVQLKVAPIFVVPVKLSELFEQSGPLLLAPAVGTGLIVTVMVLEYAIEVPDVQVTFNL